MRWNVLALMLFAAQPLLGQERAEREGLWWGFGIGYGTYRHTCDHCDRPTGATGIATAYVALGGTVTSHLTLGIELASGRMKEQAWATSLSLLATVYPWVKPCLFLRGGVGTSTYRQYSYVEFPPFHGSGDGWLAAVGWDVRVPRGPSFTPMISYRTGHPGTVVAVTDTVATNLRQRSVAFTLGLTFH
jgi:hypothetical protein